MPVLLGAHEHPPLVVVPHRRLIGTEGALDLVDVVLDAATARLQIGGVLDHQQGKLGAAHIGDVIEQVLHRDHAGQGGVGEIQHPRPYVAQFAREKEAEYHVDDGNDRKDHGNLLADGEILVRHGGGDPQLLMSSGTVTITSL
ncbi:hypothetical protein D3C79_692990 [compost metagenome]